MHVDRLPLVPRTVAKGHPVSLGGPHPKAAIQQTNLLHRSSLPWAMSKLELFMVGAEATTSLWKQQLHTRAMSKATIVMKEGRGRSAFRNPDAPTVSPSVPIVSTVSEGIDLSVMSYLRKTQSSKRHQARITRRSSRSPLSISRAAPG